MYGNTGIRSGSKYALLPELLNKYYSKVTTYAEQSDEAKVSQLPELPTTSQVPSASQNRSNIIVAPQESITFIAKGWGG